MPYSSGFHIYYYFYFRSKIDLIIFLKYKAHLHYWPVYSFWFIYLKLHPSTHSNSLSQVLFLIFSCVNVLEKYMLMCLFIYINSIMFCIKVCFIFFKGLYLFIRFTLCESYNLKPVKVLSFPQLFWFSFSLFLHDFLDLPHFYHLCPCII